MHCCSKRFHSAARSCCRTWNPDTSGHRRSRWGRWRLRIDKPHGHVRRQTWWRTECWLWCLFHERPPHEHITSSSHHTEETDAGLDRPLHVRNKLYNKTLKSQNYYSNILRFLVPWRSALWLYNTSWLDQNLSKRFLKQLTVSAETTWFERLLHMGITRLVKLNFLKS